MTVTAPDRFGSLDDALGPATGRYFGDGYRAVRRSLGPIGPTGTPGALTGSGTRSPGLSRTARPWSRISAASTPSSSQAMPRSPC